MHSEQRTVENMLDQLRQGIIVKMSSGKKKIMENEGKEALGSGLEIGDCSALHVASHLNICHMESCRDMLKQVENAQARLRGGAYGSCALCDGPIGMGRLRFLPFAVHCRQCQEELERCRNQQSLQDIAGI